MKNYLLAILILTVMFASASAQGTAFTYQGQLEVSGSPANGNYDLEFRLFDAAGGGTQLGTTLTRTNVAVAGGAFTVSLDFGGVFPGANRFLEISVRQAGGGAYTTLQPRQPVTSTPYAIKSLNAETSVNATQLGGVAASSYVVSTDPRMTDARVPTPGSGNYIQNTTTQQPGSNFNVSGTGTANVFNAATQYNIGGNRVLSTEGSQNLLVGVGAGTVNTGIFNAFFGSGAGNANTTGDNNAFFGTAAGFNNTTGIVNAFAGAFAGNANTTGDANSFFGTAAGFSNTTGINNAFFGTSAGRLNTTANDNAFFGRDAGRPNTTGGSNAFFGTSAGQANTTGGANTLIGFRSNVGPGNLTNATAIGHRAIVSANNSLVLGSINGLNGATQTVNVGIGTASPTERLHVVGTGRFTGALAVEGNLNVASSLSVSQNANVTGNLTVGAFQSGSTSVCRTAGGILANCSSSARYKTNVVRFSSGLDMINRLRPVSFNWKQDDMLDLGLVAEDVAEIEPLLVTYNDKGEIEGVKYDRIGVVLVNALKEQQTQIEKQQVTIDLLTRYICEKDNNAPFCKE